MMFPAPAGPFQALAKLLRSGCWLVLTCGVKLHSLISSVFGGLCNLQWAMVIKKWGNRNVWLKQWLSFWIFDESHSSLAIIIWIINSKPWYYLLACTQTRSYRSVFDIRGHSVNKYINNFPPRPQAARLCRDALQYDQFTTSNNEYLCWNPAGEQAECSSNAFFNIFNIHSWRMTLT